MLVTGILTSRKPCTVPRGSYGTPFFTLYRREVSEQIKSHITIRHLRNQVFELCCVGEEQESAYKSAVAGWSQNARSLIYGINI